ncbi:MAG: hypothetical protein HC771_00780 [Synechococcales cyanobacterium CRU_2_2]|nr:hypothetical protein [Synechococcales cyanobacterium CRU_2_2]
MSIEFKAADLAQYFPLATQQQYVEQFHQRYDYLTRYQAECFVRLWGYCLIKRHTERASALPSRPLDSLEPLDRSVSCTQREAAELFYAGRERGSDRSAGMMLDKLADKKLVRKEFDGNLTYISICPPAGFIVDEEECQALGLVADDFNDRTDAVPVASFLKKNYSWLNPKREIRTHNIIQRLRQWAEQYPKGMRVLRRKDNGQAIGFYIIFPTHSSSECKFSDPPSESLYLFSTKMEDPIRLAAAGDTSCYAVFIRGWHIEPSYRHSQAVLQLLQDAQQRLEKMRGDFPNLCDLYTTSINPEVEALGQALGFQSTVQDPKLSLSWLYLALDHFLENKDIATSINHLFP